MKERQIKKNKRRKFRIKSQIYKSLDHLLIATNKMCVIITIVFFLTFRGDFIKGEM